MAATRLSMLRPQVGLLNRAPQLATRIVFNQLPKAAVTLGIRGYASQNQGKQILLRDHGVIGELNSISYSENGY